MFPPLRRVFEKTAEPVRELLHQTQLSTEGENIFNDIDDEEMPGEDYVNFYDSDALEVQSPSVEDRDNLSILNNREEFERALTGVGVNGSEKREEKSNSVLVITANIATDSPTTSQLL